MISCTCGSHSLNPLLDKSRHANYCDLNKKYIQRWVDFQEHMMYNYHGGRYLYVTDDRERLSTASIYSDFLPGEDALKALKDVQYQEIWIEDEGRLAQEVYEYALKTQGMMSIVRMLRDL